MYARQCLPFDASPLLMPVYIIVWYGASFVLFVLSQLAFFLLSGVLCRVSLHRRHLRFPVLTCINRHPTLLSMGPLSPPCSRPVHWSCSSSRGEALQKVRPLFSPLSIPIRLIISDIRIMGRRVVQRQSIKRRAPF